MYNCAGPPARFAPDRQGVEGTAERPGKRVQLATEAAAKEEFDAAEASYPEDVKVQCSFPLAVPCLLQP